MRSSSATDISGQLLAENSITSIKEGVQDNGRMKVGLLGSVPNMMPEKVQRCIFVLMFKKLCNTPLC